MTAPREFVEKRARIVSWMVERGFGALLLGRAASVSWASCGHEANVGINSESAAAALLFTPRRDYLLANRIEMPRLLDEELGKLPFEPVVYSWHEPHRRSALVTALSSGRVASDVPLEGTHNQLDEIAALRHDLTPEEQDRFRELGRRTGAAIEAAARKVTPGMTEREIAGLLTRETWDRGATPVVTLVGADERVARYRHPTPTDRRLERVAMLVLCARRDGLIASATRMVHFGAPSLELVRRARAAARIDAVAMLETRPGRAIGAVFERVVQAYADEGFAQEWRDHHQGGLAGYENREIVADPRVAAQVRSGQVYAWNPSIAGAKSEDTMLVGAEGPEILTATGEWPCVEVEVEGGALRRPAILER